MRRAVGWTLLGVLAVFLTVQVADFATDGFRGWRAAPSADAEASPAGAMRAAARRDQARPGGAGGFVDPAGGGEVGQVAAPPTGAEEREADEELAVDAFDGLTDKWLTPSQQGVTMADVDLFVAAFRRVPKARQAECVHRALNLIPDENVMLLVGIMMDRAIDREIVETVYNDVLNRDEDVKLPILRQIFKDKSHPCWAATAWILDVTGELPAAKPK